MVSAVLPVQTPRANFRLCHHYPNMALSESVQPVLFFVVIVFPCDLDTVRYHFFEHVALWIVLTPYHGGLIVFHEFGGIGTAFLDSRLAFFPLFGERSCNYRKQFAGKEPVTFYNVLIDIERRENKP